MPIRAPEAIEVFLNYSELEADRDRIAKAAVSVASPELINELFTGHLESIDQQSRVRIFERFVDRPDVPKCQSCRGTGMDIRQLSGVESEPRPDVASEAPRTTDDGKC